MRRFLSYYQFNSLKAFKDIAAEYTHKLTPVGQTSPQLAFRVMDLKEFILLGKVLAPEYDNVDRSTLNRIYQVMVEVEEMDNILYMSQRQGKISFYMTSWGELATTVGVGAALKDQDLLFPQYREQGTIYWRGYQIEDFVNQCMGTNLDKIKGRQMPVHYCVPELNVVSISSPLGTQIPHASGAGYGFRLNKEDRVAAAYFGDGSASEGDFHTALNFAATLNCQTMFLCRNNKYAISTPVEDQYRGDAIAGRGPAYGVKSLRVDGNDVLAVVNAVKHARDYIVKNKEPFLLEFMTYRVGDHSTSDHSVLYRKQDEIDSWKLNDPILRFKYYLESKNWLDLKKEQEEKLRKDIRNRIAKALRDGQNTQLPPLRELFNDVYDKPTKNLLEQKEELFQHLQKYGEHYPLDRLKDGLQN